MRKEYYLALFSIITTLAACEKVVQDVEIPKIESQVVIFSFLSPEDEFVKVEVSRSKPVYTRSGKLGVINNAAVTITNDGGQSAAVPFIDSLSAYVLPTTQFPIEPGRVYTVAAVVDGETVSGSCTIPNDTVGLSELTYKKLGEPSIGFGGPYFKYAYKWMDPAGAQNYYRLAIEKQYSYIYDFDTIVSTQDVCNTMWTDETKQGAQLAGVCDDYDYGTEKSMVRVYLLNTDVHYYEYHRRRLNYYGDDPFSEPFQQYNNVKGGLGVVGAYRRTSRYIKIQ